MNISKINAKDYEKVLLFRNLKDICITIQNTYNLINYEEIVYLYLKNNINSFADCTFIDIGNIIYNVDDDIIEGLENLEILNINEYLQKYNIDLPIIYIAILIKIFKIDSEFYVYV